MVTRSAPASFRADIEAQGSVVRDVLCAWTAPGAPEWGALRELVPSWAPLVLTGMGSSLIAARAALTRWTERPILVHDASELLHHRSGWLDPTAVFVLISQSGRSVEPLALAQRLSLGRASGRLIALVNDVTSPLAALASLVVPLRAGPEAAVATRTFMASFLAVHGLLDALGTPGAVLPAALEADVPGHLERLAGDEGGASDAAALFTAVDALVVVGRGPATIAAEYAALVLKETAAMPAEAMTGGAFRHGPIELVGPRMGVIVLAPAGPTQQLGLRLAADTAALGSPTWLLTDDPAGVAPHAGPLLVERLPMVPEPVAALVLAVPLQQLAAQLALARGRQPGVLLRSQKVTEVE
jgi:glucosamine--fructose-6-phosphate aminotransferase (isomerizing)